MHDLQVLRILHRGRQCHQDLSCNDPAPRERPCGPACPAYVRAVTVMGDLFKALSSGLARFVYAWLMPSIITTGVFILLALPGLTQRPQARGGRVLC